MKKLILFLLILGNAIFSIAQNKIKEPVDSEIQLNKAIELRNKGKVEMALEMLQTINEGDTVYHRALNEIIICQIVLKNYEKAIEICDRGLELIKNNNTHFYYLNKGYALAEMKKHKEALQAYEELIKEYPYFIKAHNNLAATYVDIGEYKKAYEYYKKIALWFPFHINAHFNIGIFAYNEGLLTEAFMALNMVILLSPDSEKANNVITFLNEISNNTKFEKKPKGGGFELESKEYEEIDLIIENYVALNASYKVKTKSQIALSKQNHLIFSKVGEMQTTDYFFSKYYAPFYKKIMDEKKFDQMQVFMLQASNNEKHKKIVAKNATNNTNFRNWFFSTWMNMHNTIEFNSTFMSGTYKAWYNNDLGFDAIGDTDKESKSNNGPFTFFYPNGKIKSEGVFIKGKRNGTWHFYNENGTVTDVIKYNNGVVIDTVFTYFDNNNIKQTLIVKDEKLNGEFFEYFLNGNIYRSGSYKNDALNGEMKYYYKNGDIDFRMNYVNNKVEDTLFEFYTQGRVYRKEEFIADIPNGSYLMYWPNGQLKTKGTKLNGDLTGEFETYFKSGKIDEKGKFVKNIRAGTWYSYYENGNLYSETNYDEKGKLNGSVKHYDYDGILYLSNDFKSGDITAYKYFDKKGIVLSQGSHKDKTIKLVNYWPDGSLKSKGDFMFSKGEQGKWEYFDQYSVLTSTINYKNGKSDGKYKSYYPDGKIREELTYVDYKKNGYFRTYHSNGKLSEQGHYLDDKLNGVFETYTLEGELKETYFYVSGKLNGNANYFNFNGKISHTEKFRMSVNYKVIQYDTSGQIFHTTELENGDGQYVLKHYNGVPKSTSNTIQSSIFGDVKWYYFDGKVETEGIVIGGQRENLWKWYYENGKLNFQGNYLYGDRIGTWEYFHENGKLKEINQFYYNKKHGKQTSYYENGKKYEVVNFEYGRKHGENIFYDEQENIQLIRIYNYDKLVAYAYYNSKNERVETPIENGNAIIKATYKNGKPSREMEFKNGCLHGDYKVYYYNGALERAFSHYYNELNGLHTIYYPNGNIKSETEYYYGTQNGIAKEYYENGKLKNATTYKLGLKHGECTEYDSSGKIKSKSYYLNDIYLGNG